MSEDAPRPVLQLDDMTKVFPIKSPFLRRVIGRVRAVDHVSLAVHAGETLGLVGESGSGKSTLGRLALRLIEPTSGRITLEGTDITDLDGSELRLVRRNIQMVFQDPYSSLDPHATIADSVGEPLHTHLGMRGKERDDRVTELLERVRLSRRYLDRYPHEFSGGQLQRIALARALALNPKVIVADEPVSSLDVSTQAQVLELLMELQSELGLTYLFISHDLSVVDRISERVAVMYLGRIVEIGRTAEVIGNPQHPYTQALLSAVPVPDPARANRGRIVLMGDPPSPANPPSGCRFRTRCPHVMDVCSAVDPPATLTAGGTTVYCHLHAADGAEAVSVALDPPRPPAERRGDPAQPRA